MSIIIMSDTPTYDEVKNLSISELITIAKHKRSHTYPFKQLLLNYVCKIYSIPVQDLTMKKRKQKEIPTNNLE